MMASWVDFSVWVTARSLVPPLTLTVITPTLMDIGPHRHPTEAMLQHTRTPTEVTENHPTTTFPTTVRQFTILRAITAGLPMIPTGILTEILVGTIPTSTILGTTVPQCTRPHTRATTIPLTTPTALGAAVRVRRSTLEARCQAEMLPTSLLPPQD